MAVKRLVSIMVAACCVSLPCAAQHGGGISAPDPYVFTVNTNSPGSNAYALGKTLQSSVTPATWPIIVIMGQSLGASNSGGTYTTVSANALMFNVNDGGQYPCANPALGGSIQPGVNSNGPSCLIADGLISAGTFPGVLIVNIAQDGSSAADWNNQATLGNLIDVTWKRLAAVSLTPTYIIDHQGEQDGVLNLNTSAAAYTASKQATATHWRNLGYRGPYILSLESIASNVVSTNVRTGQANSVNSSLCIVQGFDVDTLTGPTYRLSDGTHPTQTGNAAMANGDVGIITALHNAPHC